MQRKDCLGCRVTGALGLGGAAAYVGYHQRQAKTPRDRRLMMGFALALGLGSMYRLLGDF